MAFNTNGQFLKACYFADRNPFGNGACFHNGDSRDGKGEGDDESINLDLDMLSNSGISALFFCVNSFNGSTFRAVKTASSRVVALMTGSQLTKVSMALEDRRNFGNHRTADEGGQLSDLPPSAAQENTSALQR